MPFVDEQLELAHRGPQREMRVLVRQRANPNLEQLPAPRHVDRRHVALAAFGIGLDV